MNWLTQLNRWLVAAMAIVLMAVLAFLYAKTQHWGQAEYSANVALLRHLKQLDAQWESDVLKSKIGINTHYDPLTNLLTEMNSLLDELDADIQVQRHEEEAVLVRESAQLRQVFQEKSALIERFKSSNSVLRNSLAFLPTAAEDVVQSMEGGSPNLSNKSHLVLGTVNKLLLASVLFSQAASNERRNEIQARLDQLDAEKISLPPGLRERVEVFGTHVQTILREQRGVNELLSRIAGVPTAGRIDQLGNVLNAEQQHVAVQSAQYRAYLLAFSALLIALFLYVAARLVHSHTVINRVNRQLSSANENLEQRVQDRTQELRQAQNELVMTARHAGMAEIATNVLHNVGNVLNSINVSVDVLTSRIRSSKVQGLMRAMGLMKEHQEDLGSFLTTDEKGKVLPSYLSQVADLLLAEQRSAIDELGSLSQSVEHVKMIIATQQAYAGMSSLTEPTQIQTLVEDALHMHAESLTRHHVSVEKTYAQVPELPLDKARILQILVNLIGNAKQAMDGVVDRERRLTLNVGLADDRHLRVRVADNGVGIAPENLTRIFAHGFTTKKDGHGFGLHSAVNAAREMGGTLMAESAGSGAGATFTLILPFPESR